MKAFVSALVLLISCNVFAASDTLLRQSEAFQLSTEVVDSQTIKATWNIAEGYYLYRNKIDFISESDSSDVTNVDRPQGKAKKDPTFGEVQIYRGNVSFNISLEHSSITPPEAIKLLSKSQGCADIGICYPPHKQTLSLTLPNQDITQIAGITADTSTPLSLADELGIGGISQAKAPSIVDIATNQASEPLPVEEAFKFDIVATSANTLNAHWNITPGHYLYQHKIAFSLEDTSSTVSLGKPTLPEGKAYKDIYFGDVVTYEKDFEATVPVAGYQKSLTVKTIYQGCSKLTGICYPPQTKVETVDFSSFTPSPEDIQKAAITQAPQSEQGMLGDVLKNQGIFTIIGVFFLGGLLLTFTPCVFPMIPILSGIITGQGENLSRGKAFALSLAYVIPMALTYAVAGVIAGYTGANLQAALQNPWVISIFASLFVLLSLSMFGLYELQMPSAIQNKLNNISNTQRGGSLVGAGIMGILSALIVGPCVTAPLIAALAYIADTKDVVLGGLSLFMLGMGMGAPLLLIGISAGSILPRAGAWMETVKHVFGVMMLGLAIWMLDRVIAPQFTLLLTGVLLIGSAIYLGATDSLTEQSSGWKRLWKSSGFVALLLGITLVIGGAAGSKSYFSPLSGLLAGSTTNTVESTQSTRSGLQFQRIKSIRELNATLANAKSTQTPVMLDFYAYWCLPCREMEHTVFSDKTVITTLKNTLVLQVDVTDMTADDSELLKTLEVFGPPHIIFYDRNGQEKKDYRISGEMKLEPFQKHIEGFLSSL